MKNALLAVPLLVAGAAMTAGCSPTSSAASSAPAASSASSAAPSGASPSETASPASTGRSASTATPVSGTSACTTSHLAASTGGGSGGGMSQNRTGLQLKNTGSSACTLTGYPGVSWVGAGGKQVGAGAARISTQPEKTVTLAPGALASAPLDIVDASVISPKTDCDPVPVRGLRIYPPGEKAALFLPMSSNDGYGECSKTTKQPTLVIGVMQAGPQPGHGSAG